MAKEEDAKEEKGAEGAGEGGEGATEEGGEASGGGKKGGKKKLILFGAIGLVLLLGGGGAGLYFAGVFGGHKAEGEAAAQEKKAEEPQGESAFFPLGDILVNLSGEGKRPNYLKIKVTLELADKKDVSTMEALKPRIIDNFQVYLRELRIEDLRGSAGLYRLREELLLRVTEAAQPVRVRDVLFQEILVQ